MASRLPTGATMVYDAEGYDMGGAIAERLRVSGLAVTPVTSEDRVSARAARGHSPIAAGLDRC